MRKLCRYKCQFTSLNKLDGILGYFTEYVLAYNIKEAKKVLRGCGYKLGKDFKYWKLDSVNIV